MGDKIIPVKVALRIRPLINKEIGDGCRECIEVVPNEAQVTIGIGSEKAFTYDYVFGTASRQEELYNNVVEPLMDGFFNGYNATVLAYGQTGSGKTYSMGTCAAMNSANTSEEMDNGVIPKVIQAIFSRAEDMKDKHEYLIKVSFLEIHNEEINDLLSQNANDEKNLAIRETTSGEIKIAGLQEVKVASVQEMAACLEKGSSARATGATAMNTRSSRSHAIFTVVMEQKEKTGSRDCKRAKFHLVDLAGSERAKKTQASGERFKEGININKGLLALGNVISALGDEQRKINSHVPYRDSKLTRLLQDSLGGNSNTVMIACVSPADSNMEETHNTLKYADRARKIKNKPVVNRDPAQAELSKLRQQVQMLQIQLLEGRQFIHQEGSNSDIHEVLERNKQLESEIEKLTSELHDAIDQITSLHEKNMVVELSKEELKQKVARLKEKMTSRGLDLSFDVDEVKEDVESAEHIIKHFQTKLDEMEDEEVEQLECRTENESCNGESEHSDIADSSFAVQHAMRKVELSKQLQELTKALTMKEELASKMVDNDSRIASMRKQHETTVKELEHVSEKLEKEKIELNTALKCSKADPSSTKKERDRLRELEMQLGELRRKQVEHKKLQRIKEQDDQKITKLDGEIKTMKQTKVKLMRQMKEEAEKFRRWKLSKDKEINQLKQQGQKRQFEYKKLESVHLKQQAVLRRKTEEAAAANKRLKAALSKQKEAAEKHRQTMFHQNKQAETVMERTKSWLMHEIELMVSSGEARCALKEIIEDRKTLSQEIYVLKTKLQERMDEPSRKKFSLGGSEEIHPEDEDVAELRKQIQDLEIDLEVRSSQIAELQQKIIDAEQGERTKYRWNNVHTMAEAKAGLKALLSWVVEAKLVQSQLTKEKEICRRRSMENGSELEKIKNDYEKKISSVISQKENELMTLQKIHEEKKMQLESIMWNIKAENSSLKARLEEVSNVLTLEPEVKKKTTKLKSKIEEIMSEPETPIVEYVDDDEFLPHISSGDSDTDDYATPVMKKRRPRRPTMDDTRQKTRGSSICGCFCKKDCSTKRCSCKAGSRNCENMCKCNKALCSNQTQVKKLSSSPETEGNRLDTDVASGETKPTTTKSPVLGSPLRQNITKPVSTGRSPFKSPRAPGLVRSNSPKFLVPGKGVGLKQKHSTSKSAQHVPSNVKKLLNTSKSAVFTPSKRYVAPMKNRRSSSSHSKLNRSKQHLVKPKPRTLTNNNENIRPQMKNEN